MDRHPKPCRNIEECNFFKKKVCAFNHNAPEKANDPVQEETKITNDKFEELKNLVSQNELKLENKIKSLANFINTERKKIKTTLKSIKN